MTFDELLPTIFTYDPETGIISRRIARSTEPAGKAVGKLDGKGYLEIEVCHEGKTKSFRAARLAWFLHHGKWPDGIVDHRNRVRHDNRIDNLRDTTHRVNAQNKVTEQLGSQQRGDTWRVRIQTEDGRRVTLGSWPTKELADRVYLAVKRVLHPGAEHWADDDLSVA